MILIGLIIGMIIGQILLERVNNLDLHFINNIHSRTRNLRPKKVIEYGLMLVLAMVILGVISVLNLPVMVRGLIIGGVWAIIVFCFEDTCFDNARNTLR